MAARKKNCGLVYLRRSSSRQEISLGAQLAWAIAEAKRQGVQLDATMDDLAFMQEHRLSANKSIRLDDAITGADLERPGFCAINQQAQSDSSISHVFIYRRDRFARPEEATEMLLLEKKLRQLGVTLVFVDKSAGPLERGKETLAEDLSIIFEYHESGEFLVKLAERVISAQQVLARDGNRTGGNPPYGFVRVLVDAAGKELEELPPGRRVRQHGCHVRIKAKDEMKLRVWIYILDLAHQGLGGKRIAGHLNQLGIPSPDAGRSRTDHGQRHQVSGKWCGRTVLELLRNQAILGIQVFGQRSEGAHRRLGTEGPRLLSDADRNDKGRPKLVNNPPELVIKQETGFASKYDADKWQEIQQKLEVRGVNQRGIPRARDPAKYPLSCRIIDMTDGCGAIMYGRTSGQRRLYICGRYMRTDCAECDNNNVDGEAILKVTLGMIAQQLHFGGRRERLRERLEAIATQAESEASDPIDSDRLMLLSVRRDQLRDDFQTAERRLAVEKDDQLYEAIRQQYRKMKGELDSLDLEIAECRRLKQRSAQIPPSDQVDAAMSLLDDLGDLLSDECLRGEWPAIFDRLGLKIGLNFAAGQKGQKREIRRLTGGVIAFAEGDLPVKLHGDSRIDGPLPDNNTSVSATERLGSKNKQNDMASLEGTKVIRTGDCAPESDPPGPSNSRREGISCTKDSRGDMI